MSFVYPQFLWSFLLLLIPIVIHLFNFRKQRIVLFSDIRLLKQINESRKSGLKLKDWILLLLRLLAFSALILAFAQPFFPTNEGQAASGENYVSVYIDNSLSTQSIGKNGVLLDEALSEVSKWTEQFSEQDQFHLITNDIKGYQQRFVSKKNFLDFLSQVESSPVTKNMSQILSAQHELIAENGQETRLLMVSDFQKNTSDLDNITFKTEHSYLFYPLQTEQTANLFIDSISFENPVFKTGSNLNLVFRVQNTGNQNIEGLPIELIINEKNTGMVNIDIPAKAYATGEISFSVDRPGWQKGILKIDDAEVYFDDDFYFSFESKIHLNVLEINPNEGDKRLKNLYELDDFYAFKQVHPQNIKQEEINGQDLIILNRVQDIPSGLQSVLKNFVETGGSLVVVPNETINLTQYNSLLSSLKAPQLGTLSAGGKIDQINYSDDFFRDVFDQKDEKVSFPPISKRYPISVNNASMVRELFVMNDGKPLITVNESGRGKVYLQSVGLEPPFGEWRTSALFTTVFLRIAELSTFQNELNHNFGNDIVLTLPSNEFNNSESVDLYNHEGTFIKLPVLKKEQQMQILLNGKEVLDFLKTSGFYEIKADEELLLVSAFNYDRAESDLEQYSPEALNTFLSDKGIQEVEVFDSRENGNFGQNTLTKPSEIWRILLILALIFLLSEMLLNKLWKV